MQVVEFTSNFNGKLFLDSFSDVRLHNGSKYYVGAELEVKLRGVSMGVVKVTAVRSFKFGAIRDVLSFIVTGKPAYFLASMIRKYYGSKLDINAETPLHHIVFQYTIRNVNNQEAALKEWWLSKRPEAA